MSAGLNSKFSSSSSSSTEKNQDMAGGRRSPRKRQRSSGVREKQRRGCRDGTFYRRDDKSAAKLVVGSGGRLHLAIYLRTPASHLRFSFQRAWSAATETLSNSRRVFCFRNNGIAPLAHLDEIQNIAFIFSRRVAPRPVPVDPPAKTCEIRRIYVYIYIKSASVLFPDSATVKATLLTIRFRLFDFIRRKFEKRKTKISPADE